jgi:hypothetical protein
MLELPRPSTGLMYLLNVRGFVFAFGVGGGAVTMGRVLECMRLIDIHNDVADAEGGDIACDFCAN